MGSKKPLASFTSPSQPWNIPPSCQAMKNNPSNPSSLECPPIFSFSASLGSSPSTSFSASPLDSRASGRDRGYSFGTDISSTSSAQEPPVGLDFCPRHGPAQKTRQSMSIPAQVHRWSDNTLDGFTQSIEQVPALNSHQGQFVPQADSSLLASAAAKEQLVANAQGGELEAFPPLDGMELITDELELSVDEYNAGMGDYSFAEATNYQQHHYATSVADETSAFVPHLSSTGVDLNSRVDQGYQTDYIGASAPTNGGLSHPYLNTALTAQEVEKAANRKTSSDSGRSKTTTQCRKGRPPGSKLPDASKVKIALMRKIGACTYCREGRRGVSEPTSFRIRNRNLTVTPKQCDLGLPCRPCLLHFGPAVLDSGNQCRRCPVETLTNLILGDEIKWHPRPQGLRDFFGGDFHVTDWTMVVSVHFGFGPSLPTAVNIVQTSNPSLFVHNHANYPSLSIPTPTFTQDYVLPAVLSQSEAEGLTTSIDAHLTTLVEHHFPQLPLYYSRFQILDKIYGLYQHYRGENQEYAALLQLALKLLVLIHSSIRIDPADPAVRQILGTFGKGYEPFRHNVTPCLIRSEFGRAMPRLARIMLREILKGLFKISFSRRCEQHPIVVAVFAAVMMIVEGIMHHAARLPYHFEADSSSGNGDGNGNGNAHTSDLHAAAHDPSASPPPHVAAAAPASLQSGEESAAILLGLYRNCFENCHALLLRCADRRQLVTLQKRGAGDVPVRIVHAMGAAVHRAAAYLEGRSRAGLEEGLRAVSSIFDRLVGRLLLLNVGEGGGGVAGLGCVGSWPALVFVIWLRGEGCRRGGWSSEGARGRSSRSRGGRGAALAAMDPRRVPFSPMHYSSLAAVAAGGLYIHPSIASTAHTPASQRARASVPGFRDSATLLSPSGPVGLSLRLDFFVDFCRLYC